MSTQVIQSSTGPKLDVSFQLKTVICDLWENGKSYDLAICRDNYVCQTIFNGTK
jgi:hypothetical protein